MRPTVLLRLLVFSGYLILHVRSGKVICGPNQYTVTNGSLSYCLNCDTCHPGYGLYPMCGYSITHPPSKIGCKPCPNETFSSKLDSAPCFSCHQCAMLEIVAAPCTAVSDRICNGTCEKGYFFSKKVPQCQQCSYCCFDGKDEEQLECVKQGLNDTGRHCSVRLDKHCVPRLSSSTVAVTAQTHLPSLTQSPTSLKLTSSPSHSTSPSTTPVTNNETAVTHLSAAGTHSPANLASSISHLTNSQVGSHPAIIALSVLIGLVLAVLIVGAMFYMYKKKKRKRERTQNILPDRSPAQGNYDNTHNTTEVPQVVFCATDQRLQALQNTGYAGSSASATPEVSPSVTPQQTDDEVEDLPDVTAELNKRRWKRQNSKEPQSNGFSVQKKDSTTESLLDPSVHVQAGNQRDDSKGVGQSTPRRQSFEAFKRKLSLSHDYKLLPPEDPDEPREDTFEAKEKITEDLLSTGVKQSQVNSQVNTRLSTNVRELPYPVRRQVCSMLNVKRDRDFDDFRMLAEKAGLGKDKTNNVEQTEYSPTHAILTEWSIKSSEATVGKLIEMLKEKDFERMDVVKVLEDWVYENHVFSTL